MIELLIGMIGSGKTTYAKQRAQAGAMVISHDDLTEMVHQEYRYEQDRRELYRSLMFGMARQLVVDFKVPIVVDRTHLTRESRREWVNQAVVWGVEINAVAFPIELPEVHAARRFYSDSRGRELDAWISVAKHHAKQAQKEPLDWKAEGFAHLKIIKGQSHAPSPAHSG